jgi:hypothetical protein
VWRLLSRPAARATASIGALVMAVSLVAGGLRVLPWILAQGVPLGVAPALGRGAVVVSLEIACFVAPPIGFAIAAAQAVERGELRALYAIGARPLRVLASLSALALAASMAAGLAAASWGAEAAAPARLVRTLLTDARSACARDRGPARTAEVPLVNVTWICFPGEDPRVVGTAPLGRRPSLFAARALDVSDDQRRLEATDLTILVPQPAVERGVSGGLARVHVSRATIRGLPALFRGSNLPVAVRAGLLGLSAGALAAFAAYGTIASNLGNRAGAAALGAAGPSAALLVFSALERAPAPVVASAAVPAAGLAAVGSATLLALWGSRRLVARAGRG